ncbi:hypothetical protein A8O14_06085 [Polynucleobacter wuianus]|uniref:UbiA family prenyltransferase n=1 Tax=Polynucleobacter wuianus TaxID=1743168 RepID=A0A191UF71_9BURK|nr:MULTISPECIES: UbiA family prenyltransferase [Polynucleobacter]ANI99683.1 hypothetical protein A8O14_06085 [Polynucleobacter wuianus]MBU3553924.1 UbiA family prenyltransferase [Polynucleobacter sp. MWH-Post4-6-1]MBU3611228.1 UbiA family prenyltransferase [Polynucleobacter wuianus]
MQTLSAGLEKLGSNDLRSITVDLDGTLVFTDMLHESALCCFKNNPLSIFMLPIWIFQGKAKVKKELALRAATLDVGCLPYNLQLIDWLKIEKGNGRKLILCTASDEKIAKKIAGYLDIFDEVLASDGALNLAGQNKAAKLAARFGDNGFDYVGNSTSDLPVWKKAKEGVVVSNSRNLIKKAKLHTSVKKVIYPTKLNFSSWVSALRIHQWLKNLLIFVPLLAAHQANNSASWIVLFLAFFSFCLCASSVYIINDLLDLQSDRNHPRKKFRPFASGEIPIWVGCLLAPALILVSLFISQFVGGGFLPWLAIYFALTCIYSLGVKRLILIDCLALAILYTLRIVAGGFAIDIPLSFWLLAFSTFLFLSLAFVKRYAELKSHRRNTDEKVHGRGYVASDAPLIEQLGISSGYASTLVLALYLNSENVTRFYRTPEFIWGAVPLMLLWISWMWLQAHRGNMNDDPIIFALKDKLSTVIVIALFIVFIIAEV